MTTLARVRGLVHGAVRAPDENVIGATTEDLAALEQRLARPIPGQLREFLGVCNGVRIGPGGFYGVRPDDLDRDLLDLLGQWAEWCAPPGGTNRWIGPQI